MTSEERNQAKKFSPDSRSASQSAFQSAPLSAPPSAPRSDWPYADIVNLPHHVSKTHPQMEMPKRAAQFAPFAALTGYHEGVDEAARLTDAEIEPDENMLEAMDQILNQALSEGNAVCLTYFVPDEKKSGGRYETASGEIRKIEDGVFVLSGGLRIPVRNVIQIEII